MNLPHLTISISILSKRAVSIKLPRNFASIYINKSYELSCYKTYIEKTSEKKIIHTLCFKNFL